MSSPSRTAGAARTLCPSSCPISRHSSHHLPPPAPKPSHVREAGEMKLTRIDERDVSELPGCCRGVCALTHGPFPKPSGSQLRERGHICLGRSGYNSSRTSQPAGRGSLRASRLWEIPHFSRRGSGGSATPEPSSKQAENPSLNVSQNPPPRCTAGTSACVLCVCGVVSKPPSYC